MKKYIIILFIIFLSFVGIEAISQIVFAYQINPKCELLDNPIFSSLDYKKISEMCNEIKLLKYNNFDIRLIQPNQQIGEIDINTEGFRGKEFSVKKKPDEYRIFVVGSSMVFGLGATSGETTIPSILQKKFELIDNNITVINAGIVAANSASETYLIEKYLTKYEPDLIIVYEGYTDSWDIPKYDIIPNQSQSITKLTDLEKFVKNNFSSFAFPKLVYQKTHDYLEFKKNLKEEIKENSQLWKNRWERTCLSQNIPIIILMQPMVGIGEKSLTENEKQFLKSVKHQYILDAYKELLLKSKELESKCEKVLDITYVFDSIDSQVFISSAHLTDFGNEIIAQKMFEILEPYIAVGK